MLPSGEGRNDAPWSVRDLQLQAAVGRAPTLEKRPGADPDGVASNATCGYGKSAPGSGHSMRHMVASVVGSTRSMKSLSVRPTREVDAVCPSVHCCCARERVLVLNVTVPAHSLESRVGLGHGVDAVVCDREARHGRRARSSRHRAGAPTLSADAFFVGGSAVVAGVVDVGGDVAGGPEVGVEPGLGVATILVLPASSRVTATAVATPAATTTIALAALAARITFRRRPRRTIVSSPSLGPVTSAAIVASSSRTSSTRIVGSLLGGIGELDAQGGDRGVQGRLHGAERAPHRRGAVGEGEIGEIAQHDGKALPFGKALDRVAATTRDRRPRRHRLRSRRA